jgi:hypothetical protein
MLDVLAWFGVLLCRLFRVSGLEGFAPGVCFGGDTSTFGLFSIALCIFAIVLISGLGYRATQSSAVVIIILALTFLAVGSAAVVQAIQ